MPLGTVVIRCSEDPYGMMREVLVNTGRQPCLLPGVMFPAGLERIVLVPGTIVDWLE